MESHDTVRDLSAHDAARLPVSAHEAASMESRVYGAAHDAVRKPVDGIISSSRSVPPLTTVLQFGDVDFNKMLSINAVHNSDVSDKVTKNNSFLG